MTIRVAAAILLLGLVAEPASAQSPAWRDVSPHRQQLVSVDDAVRVEVLDWGGTGRPLILLAGLGNTAHVFDDFAPLLLRFGHVYGVTRRGFGQSSRPDGGYDARRLGLDVLAVVSQLGLQSPVLIGHSIAGQELSFVASVAPEQVAGVIYLDGGYLYAYWPPGLRGGPSAPPPPPPTPPVPSPTDLASYSAYRTWATRVNGYVVPESELRQTRTFSDDGAIGARTTPNAVQDQVARGGMQFSDIKAPALFVFASPHDPGPWMRSAPDQDRVATFRRADSDTVERQATAIERGLPKAQVVRLANASHYMFIAQCDEVIDLIARFLANLAR